MPRPRTRDRILDAAMDVFAEEGFAGATISEVERRVGLAVGTGSLYRHFASKEELLRAAVAREVDRCRQEMEQARRALPKVADPAARRLQLPVPHDLAGAEDYLTPWVSAFREACS